MFRKCIREHHLKSVLIRFKFHLIDSRMIGLYIINGKDLCIQITISTNEKTECKKLIESNGNKHSSIIIER